MDAGSNSSCAGFNYFLRPEDMGKFRSECASPRVQEMNPQPGRNGGQWLFWPSRRGPQSYSWGVPFGVPRQRKQGAQTQTFKGQGIPKKAPKSLLSLCGGLYLILLQYEAPALMFASLMLLTNRARVGGDATCFNLAQKGRPPASNSNFTFPRVAHWVVQKGKGFKSKSVWGVHCFFLLQRAGDPSNW